MSRVLITGCSSGFGLLTTERFARHGDDVVATVRNLARADELRALRDCEGLPITILQLDVRDSASIQAAVGAALDGGHIDVLVNNAGSALRCPVEQTDDDEMLQLFDSNVFGVVRMIRAIAPGMRERRSGTIVNVSSMLAQIPRPFAGLYAASKAAVTSLSEALYMELAPFGVRVTVIEPSPYPTRFQANEVVGRHCTPDSPYETMRRQGEAAIAGVLQRTKPDPREVADAVFDAVYATEPRFRHIVGEMARSLVQVREADGFEGVVRVLQERLSQPAQGRGIILPMAEKGEVKGEMENRD